MQVPFKFQARSVMAECCSQSQTRHSLFCCSTPAGCRCSPCPRNDDKSARCVCGAALCAARFLCQSGRKQQQRKNKQKSHKTATLNGSGCARRGRGERAARFYLLALVRLGDARVRDDLGRVNFAGGEVGHLVALCETSLCLDGETNAVNVSL